MTIDAHDGEVFRRHIPVRFGDCDPAGIVFYPRYFEMFNGVVEDWCAQELGISFRDMHLRQHWGLPTVHLETDFIAPSELGEVLQACLQVRKLGRCSLHVAMRLLGPDGGERVRAKLVLAAMDLRERRAMPLPTEVARQAARFRAADANDNKDEKGPA
ncbi:acyl-CoA thioesterase [Noviherbaspirillum aerium]|uniref:acyl-CoA thioesterase n=1 Tax=Noviherbaspirillum aerium TaxID=2588497 RepID=UPI00124EA9CF|nr:acyl-CoA thioesterase [Noviherbaspirillum aerium]